MNVEVCGVAVRNMAIVGPGCWSGREVAHELIHAHGDGTDEHDVMCYDDGYVRGQITYTCPDDEMQR